ncbi:PPPDE domain-containing protein [Psidium guajava]|nr:PPPDE domain-containing protein [Psidium guajava]
MAEEGYRVSLNVYDLSQGLARQLSTSFLGKAIEGICFPLQEKQKSVCRCLYLTDVSIQHAPVGKTPYGTPVRIVDLGVTHVPKDVFEMYLQEISPRYTAETYSLLTHNCNNFSNEVAQFLVGSSIPDYILQLPNEVMSSPMGALILPMIQNLETTLKVGAVPQVPQFRPPTSTPDISKSFGSAPSTPIKITKATDMDTDADKKQQSEECAKESKDGQTSAASDSAAAKVDLVPGDPLGDARSKVLEEITAEFTAIMASGTLRASEAAALATRRVMQRYGSTNVAMSS